MKQALSRISVEGAIRVTEDESDGCIEGGHVESSFPKEVKREEEETFEEVGLATAISAHCKENEIETAEKIRSDIPSYQ